MKALLQFTRFISSLRNISGLNFSPMKATIALLLLTLCGCAGSTLNPVNPPAVQAAPPLAPPSPNALFSGRYWFHSQGGLLYESGVIIADGKGHFTLHSMYLNVGANHQINSAGHYSLETSGGGVASQGACVASDINCPITGTGDIEALLLSSDGSKGMMVSMEGPDQAWQLQMERDPAPFQPVDLSTCDATSGVITNCPDGWVIPAGWR